MLLQDMTPEDRNLEALQAVHRAGQRAHEVVRRLLGMAYSDRENEQFEPLDVNTTIHNTFKSGDQPY